MIKHKQVMVSTTSSSRNRTIRMIASEYGAEYELGFANGGDQNNDTIPERPICEEMNVALIDGLGDKIQSSSWLLKK
jgi:hypothetical protein